MNRKLILLYVVLVALGGVIVYQLRHKRRDAAAHEIIVLNRAPKPPAIVPPPPATPVRPFVPAEYIEVAQRTLFSKDRNPNVVLPPPPPPPAPAPMPALPTYTGQMALGEPVIFLTLPGVEKKSYRAGDEIGPFTLVSFDRDTVTFDWNGKTVERNVTDLRPKETPTAQAAPVATPQGATPTPAAAQPGAAASAVTSLAPTPTSVNLETKTDNKGPQLGTDMGGGFRGCAPGDTSPAGTVLNGYRKVVAQTLMGQSCHWEQIR